MAFPATVTNGSPGSGTAVNVGATTPCSKNAAVFSVTSWSGTGGVTLVLEGSLDNTTYFVLGSQTVRGNGNYLVLPAAYPIPVNWLNVTASVTETGTSSESTTSATVNVVTASAE